MNNNAELLKFAVENIEEWPEEWTHLRSDPSELKHELFWTKGDRWYLDCDEEWLSRGVLDYEYSSFKFSTTKPQVISKEEWLEGRKENDKSKPENSVTPLQVGTYLVKREDYEDFCKDADAGGVKIFSSLWSEWMGKFPSDDEIIVYYGTAAFGTLGWDKTKNCTKPFVEYKPKSSSKTENSNTFTKSMLEAGKHVVEVVGGKKYLVMCDILIYYNKLVNGWEPLDNFEEDLTTNHMHGKDILKVYEVSYKVNAKEVKGFIYGDDEYLTLLWSREDAEKESKRKQLEEEVNDLKAQLKAKEEELGNV